MKIKGFIKMKYEQFIIRMFDKLINLMMNDEDLSWYVYYYNDVYRSNIYDSEDKIRDLERDLNYQLLLSDERIEWLNVPHSWEDVDT